MSVICGQPCSGAEVGVDWANGLVLHENDAAWHYWDDATYGEVQR